MINIIKVKYLSLAFISIFVWGISLVSTKVLLLNGFTPNNIAFFRFLIASIVMFFVLGKLRKTKLEKQDRKYFVMMALGGASLFYFFENTGLQYTSVANTALITSTIPLFTLITAAIIFKKKLLWQNIVGIPLGIAGTFILFYKDILSSGVHLKGDLFVFGSVLMWIMYSFAFKKVKHKYETSFIVYKTFVYGVLFLIPVMLLEHSAVLQIQINVQTILNILFLAVVCSYMGYYFWNISLEKAGVKITSNLILFIPVISITTGIIVLKESFSWNMVFSAVLILVGAYLTSVSNAESEF
jgi:drug/metabolite transporter (DMT)-like permease